MKAIGYKTPGAIDREEALNDIILEKPVAKGRDLLVSDRALAPSATKIEATLTNCAHCGWSVFDAKL